MERIGDILQRATKQENSSSPVSRWQEKTTMTEDLTKQIMSNDPSAAPYNPPDPVPCEYCGAPRYTMGIRVGSRIVWAPYGPERCTCPEAVAAHKRDEAERLANEEAIKRAKEAERLNERIRKIVGESGMGERFLRRTFETFQVTKDNRKAYEMAKRYADNFEDMLPKRGDPEPGRNGLFIAGAKGIGKTHLAAAIANQLMSQGVPVVCMTMIDLLERIKRTFKREDIDESSVLDIYKTVPLLVIDDIGKEPATEWAISTIYNIINGRYEAYLPIIVTTNYDDASLIKRLTPENGDSIAAEAIVDRLREMCQGIVMSGESWRSKR